MMRLPNAEKAVVPASKIVNYLLSPTHRAGKSKAAFFSAFGFSANQWQDLAEALRLHALENDVCEREQTEYGIRHVIDGTLRAPDGSTLKIRSVWFIDNGSNIARFVTAHPLRREET